MNNSQKANTLGVLLKLTFFITILIYVAIRAYCLSFTHDESLSFAITQGDLSFLNTANNHLLNTTLMAWSGTLFGNSEFSLRLSNVLAFVLYSFVCFRLFRTSTNDWLFIFGSSLILINPFLLEFFSLARGYGLALGFMLCSIFYLVQRNTRETLLKNSFYALTFASLALYANLAMINFLLAAQVIIALKSLVVLKKDFKNSSYNLKLGGILLASLVSFFLGLKRLLILKEAQQLYYGASTYMEGINSLITASIYFEGNHEWTLTIIKFLVALFFVASIISIIIKREFNEPLFYICALFFIITGGLFLEHRLFEAKYPMERVALFNLPIIALLIYHLLIHLINHYHIQKIVYVPTMLVLLLPLYANFKEGINLKHTKTWQYDASTKEAMSIIKKQTEGNNTNASISNNWHFEPAINYYIKILGIKLNQANRDGINANSDFIYDFNSKDEPSDYVRLYTCNNVKLLMKKKWFFDKSCGNNKMDS